MYKAFANCLRYSSSASSKIITPSVGGLVFSGWGLGLETDRPRNFFENRKTAFKVTPTEKPPKIMIETAYSQTWNHQAWYCTKRRVLFICFSVESVASTFQLTTTHRLPHVDFSQKRLLNVQNAYYRQNLIWVYKLIFPSTSRYREDDSNLQIYFFFFFFLFVEDTVAGLPLDVERANCGGFAPNRVHPQHSFSVPENERERKQERTQTSYTRTRKCFRLSAGG